MGEKRRASADSISNAGADAEVQVTAHGRQLDFLAFGIIAIVITALWRPTLASGGKLSPNEDFFLYASRHEAVRKSIVEYHTLPLRSHWFGGGFPTLGEPEDPALNPLFLLSLVFGPVMGLKLMGFVAALTSALGTYALGRYVLHYTRWGALFSALMVGGSLFVPSLMSSGNPHEVCQAYLPLCMLLIALSCRGRRTALFLLPFVFYTMLCSGKQAFVMAMLYLGVLCLLDAVPLLRTLTPGAQAGKLRVGALAILVLALGVAFFVGMVRILPLMEFINAKGGLTHLELEPYFIRTGHPGSMWPEAWTIPCGARGQVGFVTIGWLPVLLFGIAACCFWKRSAPWVVTLVLFGWILLAARAPLDLFGLLEGLPVFSTINAPDKYFSFQVVLCIGVGAGQSFWLLRKLRRRWLEHVCAVVLIIAGVGFLYPRTTGIQRGTYTREMPSGPIAQHQEFFNVQGLNLPRNRAEPSRAVGYLNVLRNVGTVDWYVAIPIAENAIPRYFVDANDRLIRNPEYRGEAFFLAEAGPSRQLTSAAETHSDQQVPGGYVTRPSFRPNSITVEVSAPTPGVLVINQNYHPAWRTDRGQLLERDGLLAVRLQETGSYTVHLRYLPRSFVVGLAISALSLLGWALGCWIAGNLGGPLKRYTRLFPRGLLCGPSSSSPRAEGKAAGPRVL